MSEAKKDLAYYLAHTDEMPTDPKLIEELANEHMQAAMEKGGEQLTVDRFVKPDEKADVVAPKEAKEEKKEPEVKADEKPKEEPKAEKPEAKPEEKPEAKPEGVLAKDGKNVIPFAVLESARERAAKAEELAAEKEKEIERLKAEAAGKKPAEEAKTEMLTEEELSALEADSPTLAKVLRSQQQTILKLNETVESLAQRSDDQAKAEEADVKSEIQAAIDATPTLAAWQVDKDQTAWNEAAKFDRILRENPKYADVPFEDRFAKVVELTKAALGLEVERPQPKEEPKLTPEEVKAAAQAKLKAKPQLPRSLSDIPGGAPPAVDEKEKVEQMSTLALGNQFLGMTKDQLEAYLASL